MRLRRTTFLAPNRLGVLQRALNKEILARVRSRIVPIYLINEHPGSGATWLKFMLADALGLSTWSQDAPVTGSCVMQAHFFNPRSRCRTVALFRDGRDVMVSCYFKAFFLNEWNEPGRVRFMRNIFRFADYENVRANLAAFMRRMLDDPISPHFSWVDFVRAWAGRPGVVETRYEALRADTAGELARVVEALTGRPLAPERAARIAEAHTMAQMRARAAGSPKARQPEVSFYRSGRIGGWTDYFTDEALAWFEDRAGAELERLGYALGRPGDGGGKGKPTA